MKEKKVRFNCRGSENRLQDCASAYKCNENNRSQYTSLRQKNFKANLATLEA